MYGNWRYKMGRRHKKKIMRLINDILTIKKTGKLSGHTGPHGANPNKRWMIIKIIIILLLLGILTVNLLQLWHPFGFEGIHYP